MHQGGKLKYLIDNQKLSNREIAAAAGLSHATLYNYYTKETIPVEPLKKLCEVLKVDYIKVFILGNDPILEQSEVERLRAENAVLLRENQLLREQVEQLKIIAGLTKRPRKK